MSEIGKIQDPYLQEQLQSIVASVMKADFQRICLCGGHYFRNCNYN